MRTHSRRGFMILATSLLVLALMLAVDPAGTRARSPVASTFEDTWARTDAPVADGAAARTWMWGPEGLHPAFDEPYANAPGNERLVQYFDKSRMELTDPAGDPASPWYVTNGLLVVEMISGQLQLGDATLEPHNPAEVPVAGDPDDTLGPTYATLAALLTAPPLSDGAAIVQRINRAGDVWSDPALAARGATAAQRVTVPGIDHQVASPFWSFMNASGLVEEDGALITAALFLNPFYATGYPLSEAYWAQVTVGGTPRDVLLQCFERRCLTWTPDNPPGWRVEAGNVGQHYYRWRYGDDASPTPTATSSASATASMTWTATATPTSTLSATPTSTATPTATATNTPTPTATPSPTPSPAPEPGAEGRVYVSDLARNNVKVFDLDGAWLFTFGGSGSQPGQFFTPEGIAVDQDNGWVYVVDGNNERVQKFDLDGNHLRSWGSEGTGDGQFVDPQDVAIGPNGAVFVTDRGDRVQRFTPDGDFVRSWGGEGSGDGEFDNPAGIAVNENARVFVADRDNDRVQKFTSNGVYVSQWGGTGVLPWGFEDTAVLATDSDGALFIGERTEGRIVMTDYDGNVDRSWTSTQLDFVAGIAVDPRRTAGGDTVLYVTDPTDEQIIVFEVDASAGVSVLFTFGENGTGDAEFTQAEGIGVWRAP